MAIPKRFRTRKMYMWNFLLRLSNAKILNQKGIFFHQKQIIKSTCKKLIFSFLKIYSEFSSWIKLPTGLFYMIREQEIIHSALSFLKRITPITSVIVTREHFLCIIFAVEYFGQKKTNYTLIKHFLPWNI